MQKRLRKTILCVSALILSLAALSPACAPSARYWIPPRNVDSIDPPNPTSVFSQTAATLPGTIDPTNTVAIPAPTPTQGKAALIPTPTPDTLDSHSNSILYYAQAADTLPVVAVRFGVETKEIQSVQPIPESAYLTPGQLLLIPLRLSKTTSSQHLIPDSEVVFSPSATDFDISSFVRDASGKLGMYQEWMKSTGLINGAEVVRRVATDNSVNPRLLLALLEYQSGWVFGTPDTQERLEYPLGYRNPNK